VREGYAALHGETSLNVNFLPNAIYRPAIEPKSLEG